MTIFGDWLRDQRKAQKLTQEELADRSRLSKSYISTLERGAVHSVTGADLTPSRDSVEAIARGLGISYPDALKAAGYLPEATPLYEYQSPTGTLTVREDGTEEVSNAEMMEEIKDLRQIVERLAELLGQQKAEINK